MLLDPKFRYQLEDAVREGGDPFHRAHGTHAFEFLGSDPRFNEVFNKTMIHHTAIVINRMLERYKGFEHLKTLVDVGGGLGMNLNIITTKYPSLKGINFDLPYVIQRAPTYLGMVLAFFHFLLTSVFHLASLPTK